MSLSCLILITILFMCCGNATIIEVSQPQINALYDLYSTTNGNQWYFRSDEDQFGKVWNFSTTTINPCDGWQGIICEPSRTNLSQGVITELSLNIFNIQGMIPNSISNLTSLEVFTLIDNYINGTIPKNICTLQNLIFLDFSVNDLDQTIPNCLFTDLIQLEALNLAHNRFTGHIYNFTTTSSSLITTQNENLPETYCKHLFYLNLGSNLLTGPIPYNIYVLRNLSYLYFDTNYFTSTIPGECDSVIYVMCVIRHCLLHNLCMI